jgi:hypothetical protein
MDIQQSNQVFPNDAHSFEVFAIKDCKESPTGKEAYIGYKLENGNFCFTSVPFTEPKQEPKQETLEEAAFEKYPRSMSEKDVELRNVFLEGLQFGAKCQAERMYSDIELFTEKLKDKIDSFEYYVNQNSYISDYIKEWFEQFKKK